MAFVAGIAVILLIIFIIWVALSPYFYRIGKFVTDKYKKVKIKTEDENE